MNKLTLKEPSIIAAGGTFIFLCLRHGMVKGHIEFTLSICVFSFVCLRYPESCLAYNIILFENNFAQMIIMTRGCVANKNHVAKSKVKVRVST